MTPRQFLSAKPRAWLALCLVAGCSGGDRTAQTSAHNKAGAATAEPALGGVHSSPLGTQRIGLELSLVGSVAYNPDKVALVGPLVAGRIATLAAAEGTVVHRGQMLAEVESPQAGQAMAQYITAAARSRAAQAQFAREKELAQKHISSARDLEVAEAQAAQVQAEYRAAEELLQALGLDAGGAGGTRRGRVPLRSPIDGMVVERFVKLGEAVESGTDAFLVADLSTLWVELQIFERDLEHVRVGQEVQLRTESWPGRVFAAKVAFVEPTVDVKTRTTNLRLELDNKEHLLHPGQFVTAHVGNGGALNSESPGVLAVARPAVQTLDGKTVIFIEAGGKFTPREVVLGQRDANWVEILSGAKLGEAVVTEGAFLLKAQKILR